MHLLQMMGNNGFELATAIHSAFQEPAIMAASTQTQQLHSAYQLRMLLAMNISDWVDDAVSALDSLVTEAMS